jgi:rubredoxin
MIHMYCPILEMINPAEGGIVPGTPFEEIPYDWVCPLCGVGKDDFEEMEE